MSATDWAYYLAAEPSGDWTWKVIDTDGVVLDFGQTSDELEAYRMALSYIAGPADGDEPAGPDFSAPIWDMP